MPAIIIGFMIIYKSPLTFEKTGFITPKFYPSLIRPNSFCIFLRKGKIGFFDLSGSYLNISKNAIKSQHNVIELTGDVCSKLPRFFKERNQIITACVKSGIIPKFKITTILQRKYNLQIYCILWKTLVTSSSSSMRLNNFSTSACSSSLKTLKSLGILSKLNVFISNPCSSKYFCMGPKFSNSA